MRHLSRVITILKVDKYQENWNTDRDADYYPTEYFINEILSNETRDDVKINSHQIRTTKRPEISMPILKINDVICSQKMIGNQAAKPNSIVFPPQNSSLKSHLYQPESQQNLLLRNL